MTQRDYVLRLIEQVGAALQELRRRIVGGNVAPARIRDELSRVSAQAGFDLAVARALSGETLRMLVSPTGEVDPTRCWLLAELLLLDGMAARADDRDEDARAGLAKARLLFSLVEPGGGLLVGFPEAADRVAEIDQILAEGD